MLGKVCSPKSFPMLMKNLSGLKKSIVCAAADFKNLDQILTKILTFTQISDQKLIPIFILKLEN